MKCLELELVGGFHAGPLFVPVKRRAPLITSGKTAGRRRRMRERRAMPPWVKLSDLRPFYREAKRLTRETGELHVVDHIVPLDGEIVCGLHVPHNLRVTHWRINAIKANRYWPDMPFEQLDISFS
ncbi:hypothetical protein KDX27_22590 [Burkholderia cenocepacia]|uniref:hypothetical protein n=1 Tax=Burkholderia TaxID=32008 RepID=UPI000DADE9CF|nr:MULTISPECIES: hypothetical protein [Burkholderia]MDP9548311.1 hypothetical protein [Burkholderia cepacia]MBR8027796.1 hypothetical protein [Burkholderia cenocepacia]MBR8170526.1 hypothetical protein [Burkholderia cenocepacia]MBR8392584.1 hypothetical protein [Burkholderia cenocepacia]MBR8469425.1 hypothetical protein [Burkholderia cenocepacia]